MMASIALTTAVLIVGGRLAWCHVVREMMPYRRRRAGRAS